MLANGFYIADETSNAIISNVAPAKTVLPTGGYDSAPIWNVSANPIVSTTPIATPQPASAPPTTADTPATPTAAAGGPSVMSGLGNMFGADFPASILDIFNPSAALEGAGAPAPTTQPAGTGSLNMWLVIGVAAVGIWYLLRD